MTQQTEMAAEAAAEAAAKEANTGQAIKDLEEEEEEGHKDPLPRWAILACCLCNFAHFYSLCSLFSYAGIMSVDMGWAEDRDQAGFVAGFLSSANTVGRIPTSAVWGLLASKIGATKAMTASMVSVAVGTFLFGLCTDLTSSLLVRGILLGCGNGFVALFPAISVELGGEERQTEVVGIVYGSATFIQLFGPAIGGWTYGVSERFPAILPNLVGSILALVAVYASCRWLPAQKPRIAGSSLERRSKQGSFCALMCRRPMPFLCFLRLLHGMVNFAFFEVVPLFAISGPELGGLGLSEDELGVVLSCSALGIGLFTTQVTPRAAKRLGLRRATALGAVQAATALALLPFVPGLKSLVVLHMLANSGISIITVTSVSLVNNATPPEQRSLVAGLLAAIESLGKGAGPVLSAIGFAWTLMKWGKNGHSLVFLGLSCVLLVLVPGIALLPGSVENGKSPQSGRKAAYAHAQNPEEEMAHPPQIVGVPVDELHVVHPEETSSAARPLSARGAPYGKAKGLPTPRLGRKDPKEREGAKEHLMQSDLTLEKGSKQTIETLQEEATPARDRALSA